MTHELHVRVIRDEAGIEEVRDVWSGWQQHPNADIDFYLLTLRSRPEMVRPHVIMIYRGGLPDAMLVGRIERARIGFKIGYKTLARAHALQMTLINGGEMGNLCEENGALLIREVVAGLRGKEADLAFFNHLRTDMPLYQAVCRTPDFLARDHFQSTAPHRGMTLPDTADELYNRLSGKARKNLKWQARKFLNEYPGAVCVHAFRETAELDKMFQDVEQVARGTYQRGLGVGFVDSADTRKRFALEAEKGWLRANVLYVRQEPCAFWIGSLYGDVFHSNFMGYDSAYAKYSPGMYLIMKTLDGFIGREGGDHPAMIDFGLGDAQYKEVLGNCQWQDASLYIFGPTLKGMGLKALQTSFAFTDKILRASLERTQMLQRVKTFWRNHARKTKT